MLIYGINPVLEALKAGRISHVRVGGRGRGERQAAGGPDITARLAALNPRLGALVRLALARHVPVEIVDAADLDRLAHGEVHQGVVGMLGAGRAEAWTPERLVAEAPGIPLIVVLDAIEDPQNVGAILRSADAAGASGVIRQTRRSAPLGGAAAKASAGALAHVRVADVVNVARALEALKGAGVWTVGLAGDGPQDYDRVDLTLPTAIVLGAEGTGLRRLVRERCDWVVRIPMRGHVESLNVSVAAGVVLFEALRQRRLGRP